MAVIAATGAVGPKAQKVSSPAKAARTSRRPPVIGIIGGVASGKSLVAKLLAERGAHVLSADEAGHAVLREPEVEQIALDRWGPSIFGPEGHIDRRKLAKLVFAGSPQAAGELAYLEQVTHPRIGARLLTELQSWLNDSNTPAVVLDAAVMFKAGWNKFCNHIVYVEAPRELRVWRARQRGWSQDDFERREAAQESLQEKKQCADLVIDNAGTPAATRAQLDALWESWVGSCPPR